MNILVTGATGFVGSALTRRLSAEGREVHVMVRQGADLRRIAGLPGVILHEGDLRDAGWVIKVVTGIHPRVVYHCAVYGGFSFQEDRRAIFDTNLIGTVNLLQACEQVGFDRFVNTGSSSEYGIKDTPMRESDLPEPRGDYGVAKCAATLYCRSEGLLKGLPIVNIRLFSPYGPWDAPRRFIPAAIRTLLAGKTLVLSTPHAVRDYLYIDDVVDLYRLATGRSLPPGEILNCGSGQQVSISEVAECICEITGGPRPVFGDDEPRRTEPEHWVADIDKARELLGWTPQFGLADGLSRTVAWMREHPDFL